MAADVARMKAGDACVLVHATATQVAALKAADGRRSPLNRRGRAMRTARGRTVASLPLPSRLHRMYRSCVKLRTATSLRTLSRPRPRQLTTLPGLY